MPARWKIFFSAACIQLVLINFIAFNAVRNISENHFVIDTITLIFAILFCVAFILSSVVSIYIFNNHLPDKPLSGSIGWIQLLSIVLHSFGLLAIATYFLPGLLKGLPEGKVMSGIMIALFSVGLYIWILQLQLNSYLLKNYQRKINKITNSTGNDQ